MSIAASKKKAQIMRQLFKTVFLALCGAVVLNACGAAQSPDELIIGDWNQVKAISIDDAGVSLEISESSARYLSDGTSQSSARLKIGNVPDALSTYEVKSLGTWKIERSKLIETITNAEVISPNDSPQAAGIARQMQDTILAAEPSTADILALTKTQMTLYEAETNYTIRFERR